MGISVRFAHCLGNLAELDVSKARRAVRPRLVSDPTLRKQAARIVCTVEEG